MKESAIYKRRKQADMFDCFGDSEGSGLAFLLLASIFICDRTS